MDALLEVPTLPSGFREVTRTDKRLPLDQSQLPWLEESRADLELAKITLTGEDLSFYYGSAIRNKNLIEAASQLDEARSRVTNHLIYTQLPDFVRGYNRRVDVVDNCRSDRPIYYVGNKGGQRVYFMRFDQMDGIPVIIRIAACDKARQMQVLRTITYDSTKLIKHNGKL